VPPAPEVTSVPASGETRVASPSVRAARPVSDRTRAHARELLDQLPATELGTACAFLEFLVERAITSRAIAEHNGTPSPADDDED